MMLELNGALVQHLLDIADAAGRAIMPHYTSPEVQYKNDGSPVTAADMAADTVIEEALTRLFPGVPQVSEERVDQVEHARLQDEDFFLIDPLDGTRMFIQRNGQFTVNIALIRPFVGHAGYGRPVAGVVHCPATGEFWVGAEGVGAWKVQDGVRTALVASPTNDPGGLVVTASPDESDAALRKWLQDAPVARRVHIGSSIKFCHIAEGRADVYPRSVPCMEWDVAAGHAVLRAAGGNVYDTRGLDLVYGRAGFWAPEFVARARIYRKLKM